ncbi:MAG: hypothetical protein ACI39E_04690 [Acutalibacteraceae bacterium]
MQRINAFSLCNGERKDCFLALSKTLQMLLCKVFFYCGFAVGGCPKSRRCHCAKLFINHDVKIVINSTAANNINKIPVLLTKTLCLQGFFYVLRVKKDLAELLLQGLNLIFNFALWLINGFTH